MINPRELTEFFVNQGLTYFTGVPDSLMSRLCWDLVEQSNLTETDVYTQIVANEGIAVANCIGYFLATGRPGVVFLQNAGLGNIYNPIVSLCSQNVFNIPIVFLVGWRGDPDTKDEPQHVFQGQITISTLEILNLTTITLNPSHNLEYLASSGIVQESIVKKKSCVILFANGAI